MVTISSTYNGNTTIGNSYKNGFSLDNISIENQSEYGVNIGYAYSKAYTNQEPRLSTQHDADNYNKYQWSFQYEDCVNGEETFHLKTGYMFEMNNSGHGLNGEGQFGLKYRFSMQVASCSKFLFWWNRSIQSPFNGFLDVNWR